METIKLMIVDDHQVVREGLKQMLELEERFKVIAEASGGIECLELLDTISPDIIFMDISMPGINGIEATRIICDKFPGTRIIILTVYREDQYVTEAIQAGARGYILKDVKRADLVKTVYHVMENKAVIDPVVTSGIFDQIKKEKQPVTTNDSKPVLTKRELEILLCLTEGDKDREISKKLHISEHTVRSHTKNLYKKLGVTSRSKAVVKGIQFGFVNSDN